MPGFRRFTGLIAIVLFCLLAVTALLDGAQAHATQAAIGHARGAGQQALPLPLLPVHQGSPVAHAAPIASSGIHTNATITVNNTADGGAGSLRNAIAAAASGDTINFTAVGTITLTTGEIAIAKDLTITGPGAAVLTVSGNNASRIFNISTGTVSISGLTLANGQLTAGNGGAIINAGTLTITSSTFSNNTAASSTGYGGAVYSTGTLNVANSTFSNNVAPYVGGAIANDSGTLSVANSTFSGGSAVWGGAVYNFGTLNVANSTFSGNVATHSAGAVFSNGPLNIANSTFSGNSAPIQGAISTEGTANIAASTFSDNHAPDNGGAIGNATGPLSVVNSTFSGNTGTDITTDSGQITTVQNNIFDGPGCVNLGGPGFTGSNNLSNGSCPGWLGAVTGLDTTLASNGGPTQTFNLIAPSNAIDAAGSCTYPAAFTASIFTPGVDQRGVARPIGGACDIGAVEAFAFTPTSLPGDSYYGPFYNQTIGATGGTGAVSYAVTSGNVPNGLFLGSGGGIFGKPTAAGTFTFTVTATDASGNKGEQLYSIVIAKAMATIIWNNPAAITYPTPLGPTQLNATAVFDFGCQVGQPVKSVCLQAPTTVPGTFVYTPPSGTVLNAGPNQTLSTVFTPTDSANFDPSNASVLITVNQADQTISFGALGGKTFGDAPFTVSAVATSGLPVTFSIASGPCTATGLNGSTITITGAGSCTVNADQAGNTNYNAAPQVQQSFKIAKATPIITWNTPAPITYPMPLGPTQLDATASFGTVCAAQGAPFCAAPVTVPGIFTYTPPSGTVLNAGANQTLNVSFAPTNTTNFVTPVLGSTTITVNKAPQAINFGALGAKNFGDPPFTVSAVGGASGNPVTFGIASGPCTATGLNGSTITITGAGTCVVTADQAGNANYLPAPQVQQSFVINPAPTTTTLGSSPNPSVYGQSVTFTAHVAAVNPAAGIPTGTVNFYDITVGSVFLGAGTLDGSGNATFATSTLSVGTHKIQARYAGVTNYAASNSAAFNQVVNGCAVKTTLATRTSYFSAYLSSTTPPAPVSYSQYRGTDGMFSLSNIVETSCALSRPPAAAIHTNDGGATATYTGIVTGPAMGSYTLGDHLTIQVWLNGPDGGMEVEIMDMTHAHTAWVKGPFVGVPYMTITSP